MTPEQMLAAWRESGRKTAELIRNAALEEAANVCESLYKGHEWIFEARPQTRACADAIRAMKTKEGE